MNGYHVPVPSLDDRRDLVAKKKKKTKKRKRNQSVELVGTVDHKKIRKVTGEGLGPHPDTLLPGLSHPL